MPASAPSMDELWQRWRKTRSGDARDALLTAHLGLVQRVLNRVKLSLPPEAARQLSDDLKSAGVVGLVEAFDHYRDEGGAQFTTFATWRIRGAMLDELRRQDWISKQRRHRWKQLQEAVRRVQQRLGRQASEDEIAQELGVGLEELRGEMLELGPATLVFMDGLAPDGNTDEALGRLATSTPRPPSPEELALRRGMLARLSALIDGLPPTERLVVTLVVVEELGVRAIGEILGVSAPRVSQIWSKAVLRLQAGMNDPGRPVR